MKKRNIAIIAVSLIITIFAGMLAACSQGLTGSIATNSTAVVNNETAVQETVYQMPARLLLSGSSGHSASITLTATVLPAEATNKNVDWSVCWGDAPTHGTEAVTDYVNVVPASDGSTTATVTCYQAFGGDKVLIIVTTRIGGYQAICTVSYIGTPTVIAITTTGATVSTDSGWNVQIANVYCGTTYNFTMSLDNEFHSVGSSFTPNYTVTAVGVGTFNMRYESRSSGGITTGAIVAYTLDEFINNTDVMSGTSVLHNSYMSCAIVNGKLQIVPKNVLSNLRDLSNADGRGATGYFYYSLPDATKVPYVRITVRETNTGITQIVNVRVMSEVASVTLSQTALAF